MATGHEAAFTSAPTQYGSGPMIMPEAPPPAAPASGPISLEVGAIVADRYRLNQKIGEGGMAAVFRATDLELGEEIALKVFTSPV